MTKLMTQWGESIDPNAILTEYPRPNLVRDSYINLNGTWDFEMLDAVGNRKHRSEILVPFSPESVLSGVNKTVLSDDTMIYSKKFVLPHSFIKDRVILHFEAVDQECSVIVNGIEVGRHQGGYSSFSFDITNYLKEMNHLSLQVKDQTEKSTHARGKQKVSRKGLMSSLFYTPNSGIWQTVWLESVSESYIENVRITPNIDSKSIVINIMTSKKDSAHIVIRNKGALIYASDILTDEFVEVTLPFVELWSPEKPTLYDVEIFYGEDTVQTYFGMRKFSRGFDEKGVPRFFLNNKPYIFNGLLDQGYWPESLMTPPSDDALIYDIQVLKDLNFNTIRKHVKIESNRFYYHCDRIGMCVWQDMPNGGGLYSMLFVTYLPNLSSWSARNIKDHHYKMFRRNHEEGRHQYYEDLKTMIEQLYNHPSIAVWVPFNEGWGQFDAKKASEFIGKLDGTRLINEACGWFDQGGGDIFSIHNYLKKLKVKPQKERVVALGEFGGLAFPVEGHMMFDKAFGYKHFKSVDKLNEGYHHLWEKQILPNIEKGLSAMIYTQVCDIEEEINGLMTYDRRKFKFDRDVIKELNKCVTYMNRSMHSK